MQKLCACSAGLALGIVWGLYVLVMGLAGHFGCACSSTMVDMLGKFYKGYQATIGGSFIGFGWGLLDGFIFGFLVVLVYNFIACTLGKKACCKPEPKQ